MSGLEFRLTSHTLPFARRARPVRLLGLGVRLSDSAGSGPEQRDLFAATAVSAEPSGTGAGG